VAIAVLQMWWVPASFAAVVALVRALAFFYAIASRRDEPAKRYAAITRAKRLALPTSAAVRKASDA
jgi:asparagine N-glycosylation enzyme membrane subunit Stt3